jgi:hypothetical protein
MQIIENWTDVEGEVKHTEPSKISDDFVSVSFEVNHSKPVEGFANLVDAAKGQTLTVEVPKHAAELLQKGATIVSRIRRATNKNIFAHPELTKAK